MNMRRNLKVLYAISFFQGMVFYASVATLYRQAAGLSVFDITLIESASFALSLALELPWGVLADRIGYRRTMIACNALFFLSKLVFWRASGFGGFLAERALLAVVTSGLSGVDESLIVASCGEEDAQRAFGLCASLGTAGLLCSTAVYALLIGDDMRLSALLTAVSYGVAALLTPLLRETRAASPGERPSLRRSLGVLRDTLRDRELLRCVAAFALLGEVQQIVTVFLNQLQYARAGMPPRLISAAYLLTTLAALTSAFSASLTQLLHPRRFGTLLFGLSALCCLLLAATRGAALSVAGVLTIAVCGSLAAPLGASLQNRAITTSDRATALSMCALLGDLLGVGANLLFGRLADLDLRAAMLLGAAFCLLGMLALRRCAAGKRA